MPHQSIATATMRVNTLSAQYRSTIAGIGVTKHLFSVVIGHSFIFYYFILTYKKLTPKYCEIWCVVKQHI